MSGRRRTGALAGALDLANKLILTRQEEAKERQRRSEELHQKFQLEAQQAQQEFEYRKQLAAINSGQVNYDPMTGGMTMRPPFDPLSLGEEETAHVPLPGGGYRTYTGRPPKAEAAAAEAAPSSPSLLSRMGQWFMDGGQTPAAPQPVAPAPAMPATAMPSMPTATPPPATAMPQAHAPSALTAPNAMPSDGNLRQQAITELQASNYPITDANIRMAMEQLSGS